MVSIERYTTERCLEWNNFVAASRNGTFLFDRNYMDYHSDRFEDCSLMFRNEKGKLLALLPANIRHGVLYSHQGLTYGGLVTATRLTATTTLEIFETLNAWLTKEHIKKVVYKCIPHIYHRYPAEEDLYALFKVCHARLLVRNISTTIDLRAPLKWSHGRILSVNKACKAGIKVTESNDYDTFWNILDSNLTAVHGVKPVHSAEELKLLHSRFPSKIRLFTAALDDEMLAGVVIYDCKPTIHTQYISASEKGKQMHALDIIFLHLLKSGFFDTTEYHYTDFGNSNEQQGQYLNESLIYQKESFGGRAVCYDIYEWDIDSQDGEK